MLRLKTEPENLPIYLTSKCYVCEKDVENLDQHLINNHPHNTNKSSEIRKVNKCKLFGKKLSNSYKLKVHIKLVHEGVKAFKCKYCDKTFGEKRVLNI